MSEEGRVVVRERQAARVINVDEISISLNRSHQTSKGGRPSTKPTRTNSNPPESGQQKEKTATIVIQVALYVSDQGGSRIRSCGQ
jgi:hypothetical protein